MLLVLVVGRDSRERFAALRSRYANTGHATSDRAPAIRKPLHADPVTTILQTRPARMVCEISSTTGLCSAGSMNGPEESEAPDDEKPRLRERGRETAPFELRAVECGSPSIELASEGPAGRAYRSVRAAPSRAAARESDRKALSSACFAGSHPKTRIIVSRSRPSAPSRSSISAEVSRDWVRPGIRSTRPASAAVRNPGAGGAMRAERRFVCAV